jgi:transcriptional regulator with XRE-family HTH domain
MELGKRRRLEAAGWELVSTAEFLELSREESIYVELKLRLSDALKQRRKQLGISQTAAAAKFGSSQSRVAKMEANDASVSLDLLIRSLIELNVSRQGLARIMGFDEPEAMTIQATADLGKAVLPGRPFTLANAAENRPDAVRR